MHVREFAVVGAQSADLKQLVDKTLLSEPDVAVIMIGANDVTHAVLPSASVRLLANEVTRLVENGVKVIVGTCPDLGTIRPIPQPLRQVARSWSRRLAAAQTIAVVEAGGRTVSLGSILGPEFDAAPALLFGPDQFHPSAAGYHSMAAVLIPSVLDTLGLGPDVDAAPESMRGEGVLPIGPAAVHASRHPGTELDGTDVAGTKRGDGGRWVLLKRRRRHPESGPEAPEENEETEPSGAAPVSPDGSTV